MGIIPVKIKSSMYKQTINMSPYRFFFNIEACSLGRFINLFSWKYLSILLFHTLEVFFFKKKGIITLISCPFTIQAVGYLHILFCQGSNLRKLFSHLIDRFPSTAANTIINLIVSKWAREANT